MSDGGMQSMIAATEGHLIDAIRFGFFSLHGVVRYRTEERAHSISRDYLQAVGSDRDEGHCCRSRLAGLQHTISIVPRSQPLGKKNGMVLKPLTVSIGGAFQRGRLMTGLIVEDVLEYGRVCHIYDIMKPKVASDMESTMGFPTVFNPTTGADVPKGLAPYGCIRINRLPSLSNLRLEPPTIG